MLTKSMYRNCEGDRSPYGTPKSLANKVVLSYNQSRNIGNHGNYRKRYVDTQPAEHHQKTKNEHDDRVVRRNIHVQYDMLRIVMSAFHEYEICR